MTCAEIGTSGRFAPTWYWYARRVLRAYCSHVDGQGSGGGAGFGRAADVTPSGLVVPGQWWAAAQLGLTVVPDSDWPDELLHTYLTAAEYLTPIAAAAGLRFEARWWIWAVLRQHSREDLVCALAALNHAARRPNLSMRYREHFLGAFSPEIAEIIRCVLDGERGGKPRALLARQCVLRAIRTVLVPDADQPSVPDPLAEAVRPIDLITSAIVLVHIVAAELHSTRPANEPLLGGIPESLAMEMSANGLFNEGQDPGSSVARTWLLWHEYDPDAVTPTPRRAPADMANEAVGVDLDDMLALGFAYYAFTSTREAGDPVLLDPHSGHAIDVDTVELFLARFASTLGELSTGLAACPQQWQMGPIQDRPLARIGNDIVVLDEQYLIERVTRGLYWLVHDHERDVHGDGARQRWAQTYAKMIELRVEDQLRRLAPPVLGGGSAFFTEEDLHAAFGTKRGVDKAADVGIDFGDAAVLAEIVSAQATAGTREHADVEALKKDVDRMVLKKARQLHVTATNLLRDPQPAGSPLCGPATRIYPVIVRGGAFPVNPAVRGHIEECLQQEGLLAYADARVRPLALVDLEELELCEALCKRGSNLPQILEGWQASRYASMALRSFLVLERQAAQVGRPSDVQAALDRAFTAIARRLGTDWSRP